MIERVATSGAETRFRVLIGGAQVFTTGNQYGEPGVGISSYSFVVLNPGGGDKSIELQATRTYEPGASGYVYRRDLSVIEAKR